MRVCVYASSSLDTCESFRLTASNLGKYLAKEDHVCVNGGGNCGCMGALNQSCSENKGKIVTIIHKRWVVDGEEFEHIKNFERIVVDGDDLGERKRQLLKHADCLIVLPGGLGTFDELFESACLKQLGFIEDIPICLVNVDGYYDCIIDQVARGMKDALIRKDVIHSESTARKALDYCMKQVKQNKAKLLKNKKEEEFKSITDKVGKKTSSLSLFVFMKAMILLPIILSCYTMLFMITVNGLMAIGNGPNHEPVKTTLSPSLPFVVEFFGLIFILLLACKHIK